MAKIIRLTEQDLYRIVKRVLNEELIMENSNPIVDIIMGNPAVKQCLKENSLELFGVGLDILVNCKTCRQLGLDVVIEIVLGGKGNFDPSTMDKTKLKGCVNEALDHYGKNEQDRVKMTTAVTQVITCIVDKVMSGDLPIDQTDIKQLPDFDPSQLPFPMPDKDTIDKIENTVKTGIDTVIKNIPLPGNSPVMRSK